QSNLRRLATISWPAVVAALVTIIVTCLVQSHDPAFARSRQVWFAPMDWFVRPEVGFGGSTDYMALFGARSPNGVLSHVNVFKIYAQFALWGQDDNLRRVFAELKRRHIALALETGMLTATERCGKGVEGYGGDGAAKLATRIAHLGGE